MKTKLTLLIALAFCASLAAQETPKEPAKEPVPVSAEEAKKAVAKAQAEAKRANDRRDRANKRAEEADVALRKAQGRSELTPEEGKNLVTLHRNFSSLRLAVEVDLPAEILKKQREAQQAAQAYQAELARLKDLHNAVTCAGVDAETRWTGCPAK